MSDTFLQILTSGFTKQIQFFRWTCSGVDLGINYTPGYSEDLRCCQCRRNTASWSSPAPRHLFKLISETCVFLQPNGSASALFWFVAFRESVL